jgi:hypothetical protein
MLMEDDADAPDGDDLDGNVEFERKGDDQEEEDKEKEDKEEEDIEKEDEDEEEDQDEEEDKNEDDGKEPRTIGQGAMENTSADNVYKMLED